ncbi:hypothetical protein IEN85_11395 [Pelagicoccus sp. NFK12]|uniref:Uncharacterized protein n=2 Tax=Pelagicoccus enzymogenes TaxID=2773457 RepID=A0A927FAA3_9BACT|nr:hypothetical protein [Pelagicoccus enzymogenes]MBD5780096.1 hypothetical protein [Pelagicoccus enzymogenes]
MTSALRPFLLSVIASLGSIAEAQVTLSCDLTEAGNKQGVIYNFWDTHNRLPPYESINVPAF